MPTSPGLEEETETGGSMGHRQSSQEEKMARSSSPRDSSSKTKGQAVEEDMQC